MTRLLLDAGADVFRVREDDVRSLNLYQVLRRAKKYHPEHVKMYEQIWQIFATKHPAEASEMWFTEPT